MIEHVVLPVSDYERSKAFYASVLAALGYSPSFEFSEAKTMGYKEGGHTSFLIRETPNPDPGHVAFAAKSKEEVQAFHGAALASGGTDNGPPGFRTDYGPDYYAAFVFDPDGHNIEACYFGERAPGT